MIHSFSLSWVPLGKRECSFHVMHKKDAPLSVTSLGAVTMPLYDASCHYSTFFSTYHITKTPQTSRSATDLIILADYADKHRLCSALTLFLVRYSRSWWSLYPHGPEAPAHPVPASPGLAHLWTLLPGTGGYGLFHPAKDAA